MAGTTSEFVLGGGSNSDLSRLDPAQPLVGELPWPLAEDTFVDVYAYSTPVYLGTFRVVDGKVQLSASIKSLEGGTHRLVFIGQTSQSVRVMQLTVLALANTGVALSTPFVVGALAIMLGLGLSVTSITMRRRRGLAA